uniref:Uncharacterized protein n=1 Tax=Setaria italica TaxID=4555 RepID=K3Y364_SETIT
MQLTSTIARPAAGVPAPPLHEKAKACIFLRHHIHPDLKMEYLEVRDPLVLWLKLQERFGNFRFCGQVVTELEMIEKTLETFHPTNMVLHQQYRNNKYVKYCDLINMLLAAEAQNELLMKNFNMPMPPLQVVTPMWVMRRHTSSRHDVDDLTGLHFPEPSDPSKNLESTAMHVDPISNSDATAAGGDTHVGDEDYDLDDEDLLDVE